MQTIQEKGCVPGRQDGVNGVYYDRDVLLRQHGDRNVEEIIKRLFLNHATPASAISIFAIGCELEKRFDKLEHPPSKHAVLAGLECFLGEHPAALSRKEWRDLYYGLNKYRPSMFPASRNGSADLFG